MIIAFEHIRRRLAILNVRVGDIELDRTVNCLDIIGRADNHRPGRFNVSVHQLREATDLEAMIAAAAAWFHAQELEEVPVLEDGRKVP